MNCSHCGRAPGDPRPPCSHCSDATLPVVCAPDDTAQQTPPPHGEAIDPEVLGADAGPRDNGVDDGPHYTHRHGQAGGTRFEYVSWQQGNTQGASWGSAVSNASCFPGLITFGLFVGCTMQLGLLAGIGFGFFYLLGSVLATTANARRLLQGLPLTPWNIWMNRVLVWGAALLMTFFLAGKV